MSGDGGFAVHGGSLCWGSPSGEAAFSAASQGDIDGVEGEDVTGDATDVVSMEAVWRDRARCAEEAAQELAALVPALRQVAAHNTFGIDCVEGETLHRRLRDIINAGGSELREAVKEAQALAARCRSAVAEYSAADGLEYDGN